MKTKIIDSVKTIPTLMTKEKFSVEKVEGLHVVVWLVKDFCWCLGFKNVGVLMIIPTILISLFFIYQTREDLKQLITNISVTFWITANSLWMLSEFFQFDHVILYGLPIKYYYGVLFACGILNILIYHTYRLVYKR